MPALFKQDEYKLAVSLLDLDSLSSPELITRTLAGKISTKDLIRPSESDSPAAILKCDLLVGAVALDVLRSEASVEKKGIKVFILKVGKVGWSRVTNTTPLTTLRDGKPVLNPQVFGIKPTDLQPPTTKPVELGGQSLFG